MVYDSQRAEFVLFGGFNGASALSETWIYKPAFPVAITDQPDGQAVCAGSPVTFSATHSGTPPFVYQWLRNGAPLMNGGSVSGADTPTLQIQSVQAADIAGYQLSVTNACGVVPTNAAQLTLTIITPVINDIADASIGSGSAYAGPSPSLTNPQCMTPVAWTLISGPNGMTVNSSTGVVSWQSPTPAGSPHTITLRAANTAGADTESWLLTVTGGSPCPGDLDNNRLVNIADLTGLLAHFGTISGASPADGDLNGDSDVDLDDLATLLAHFGAACP
jgi:hypothetical protein